MQMQRAKQLENREHVPQDSLFTTKPDSKEYFETEIIANFIIKILDDIRF